MDDVWDIMGDYLSMLHYGFNAKIYSFVLMSNHFHLIAGFPEGNLSAAMRCFMTETSRSIARASGRINHVYGGRSFRSQVTQYQHFMNVYKYNYRNPVEAKICERVEQYQYSTLSRLLGGAELKFPVQEDTILFEQPIELTLDWLNSVPPEEDRAAMKIALKKGVFKIPKRNRKPYDLIY